MAVKICSKCKAEKDLEKDFYKNASSPDGRYSHCKTCHSAATMAWQATENGRSSHPSQYRRGKGHKKHLLDLARRRAGKKGLTCTITEDDFFIPEFCPVLGIPLKVGSKTVEHGSASLDRIDSTRGYEPGNVQVISHLANAMKQNASPQQLLAFADWAYKTCGGSE